MTQTAMNRPTDLALTASGGVSLLAFLDSVFNYVWSGNGIHGSEGALLVIASTLLLVLAIGVVLYRWGPGWLWSVLEILIVLGFLGTSLAAYFLEAWILLGLIVLSFVAWLTHAIRPAVLRPSTLG